MDPFFCYLCFMFVLFVPCGLVITCWERADLLALLRVMFSCVFVTFPYGDLGQVWYLFYLFLVVAFFLTFLTYFYCIF